MNMKVFILLGLLHLIVVSAIPITPNHHKATPQKAQGDDCGMCEFLVGQVENFLANNSTDTEILAKVEDSCKYLVNPSWIADCKGLIGTYGPQIIQALVTKETPAQVCSLLQLCNSSKVVEPVPAVGGAIECMACTFLVKQAESYLQANHSETEIIQFLSNDCKILKDQSWIATCQGLVQEYGVQIINLLVNKADPNTVCDTIGICNSTVSIPKFDVSGGAECMMCEWLVGQIENYLAANSTESEIISGLTNACKDLKEGSFIAMCQAVVTEYAPEMIGLLVNEQTPSKVCTEVTLCTSSVGKEGKKHHKGNKHNKAQKHKARGSKVFKMNKH